MKETAKKTSYGVGIQNWILIFSIICAINFALGTWKYKNVSDRFICPSEYIELFIHYIRSHFRSFILLLLCVVLQSILSVIIEKSLIYNYVSESAGLACHLINSLLPTNFALASSYLVYIDPCTLFFVMVHVIHITFLRGISYAFVNSRLRKEWRECIKENAYNKKETKNVYPQNINIRDSLRFWFGAPSGTYKPEVPSRIITLNLSWLGVGLVKAVIFTYISLNILHVFVAPAVEECVQYIEKGVLSEALGCFLRLLIPVNLLWLIGVYYFGLVTITGTWSKVVGYRSSKQKDWWNSETVSEYWTKWNYFVHEWYKETIFIPLVKSGISSQSANVAIFAFSGLLHVFFVSIGLYN
ncbi:diacylglycerol O-acyltransferase 1-like isoform X1 [Agrilus planipennis]|uniref:diacylglycerol O-acyltransferase n=1 Tax=Agrilus planipennis TaxID=224129 RepID=A0A1W4WTD1_AGRPL|nr:diacylglycerol O-acyltransferase 1-like isoform X1 [Agrilus planipennis]